MRLRLTNTRYLAAFALLAVSFGCGGGGADQDPVAAAPSESVSATFSAPEETNANLTPITELGPEGDTRGTFKGNIVSGSFEQSPGPEGVAVRRFEMAVDISKRPEVAFDPYAVTREGLPGEATVRLTQVGADGVTRTWVAVSGEARIESIKGNTITVSVTNARLEADGDAAQGAFVLSGHISFEVN